MKISTNSLDFAVNLQFSFEIKGAEGFLEERGSMEILGKIERGNLKLKVT